MALGFGSWDSEDDTEVVYPRVVFVLMARGSGPLSDHNVPVGYTYNEERAIRWVQKDKTYRSYLGLEETSV